MNTTSIGASLSFRFFGNAVGMTSQPGPKAANLTFEVFDHSGSLVESGWMDQYNPREPNATEVCNGGFELSFGDFDADYTLTVTNAGASENASSDATEWVFYSVQSVWVAAP